MTELQILCKIVLFSDQETTVRDSRARLRNIHPVCGGEFQEQT